MGRKQQSIHTFFQSFLSFVREKTNHYYKYYRISKENADNEYGRNSNANEKSFRDKSIWESWSYLNRKIENIDLNSVNDVNDLKSLIKIIMGHPDVMMMSSREYDNIISQLD